MVWRRARSLGNGQQNISALRQCQKASSSSSKNAVSRRKRIIRELSSPEIDIETDDKNVTSIRAGSSFFKIRGLAAEEFPPLPKFKE
ncbi:MAG TPA: hypothetical protein VNT99_14910, partial [Methylomirabilota bacterium]|nr:hypothetical protein [Methylomirabilota bacterium]